eukprot:CAMPEP_0171321330 /NCGR_PEP_ID=MMETSP0816-20121228/111380_1 /TAXON_ID=420281 /ORGANISM="Proboscia inermis, Strain CCAP1064/1" /LENGTH=61 /DNA_ID=CAMNT_0011819207 /DNA_START=54 /DNA_END=236 /DNA_ORIENTATION=-
MIERSNKETLRSIAAHASSSSTASASASTSRRDDRHNSNSRMSSRSYLEEEWVDEYCKQPI